MAGYTALFDEFWKAYPRRVGKDAARRAFAKRKPDRGLLDDMLTAIDQQKQTEQWRKNRGQFIPFPATWLNRGSWEDEVEIPFSEPPDPVPSAPKPEVQFF